jgi:heat-inducible transcriptional repressor
MAELEQQGYICQPHTSAGRVPTEKGYRYYTDNFLTELKLSKKQQQALDGIIKSYDDFQPQAVKQLAKEVAELSRGTVFVSFADNDFYYTGLSNMFAEPEFAEHDPVYHLSKVIDHFDQALDKFFSEAGTDVEIVIGSGNPFGKDCSFILAKYGLDDNAGIVGILGPTRMDYQNNVNLIKYSQFLINKLK